MRRNLSHSIDCFKLSNITKKTLHCFLVVVLACGMVPIVPLSHTQAVADASQNDQSTLTPQNSTDLQTEKSTTTNATTTNTLKAQSNNLPLSASASGIKNGHIYVIKSLLNKKVVLSIKKSSAKNGANAQVNRLLRGKNQQWVARADARGYVSFRNVCSGKYLNVAAWPNRSGANVEQRAATTTMSWKWKVTRTKNANYRIRTPFVSGCSLAIQGNKAANGKNVCVRSSGKRKALFWKLYDVTAMRNRLAKKAKKYKKSVKAGKYVLFSKAGSYMSLDIQSGSSANCANAQTWLFNGTPAQRFTISYDKKGYAHLKNGSGKFLDVSGAEAGNGTNVQQYKKNNTLAQKWIIIKKSNGWCRIQSALWASVSLDVSGGLADNGTNVQIYASNNTKAQKWKFLTLAQAKKSVPVILTGTTASSFSGISLNKAKSVGIDVSQWQGSSINWNAVAASGVRFAIIRCGYGSNTSEHDDWYFKQNVERARAAGLVIGVYLYSHATNTNQAKDEANHTLRMLKSAGLTPAKVKYGVYYDIEAPEQASLSKSALAQICKKYCNTMVNNGYKAGVYASLSWWNSKLTNNVFNNWFRWIAQWPKRTGGRTCSYKKTYKMWQCMSDGAVPGIPGRVDMNILY